MSKVLKQEDEEGRPVFLFVDSTGGWRPSKLNPMVNPAAVNDGAPKSPTPSDGAVQGDWTTQSRSGLRKSGKVSVFVATRRQQPRGIWV